MVRAILRPGRAPDPAGRRESSSPVAASPAMRACCSRHRPQASRFSCIPLNPNKLAPMGVPPPRKNECLRQRGQWVAPGELTLQDARPESERRRSRSENGPTGADSGVSELRQSHARFPPRRLACRCISSGPTQEMHGTDRDFQEGCRSIPPKGWRRASGTSGSRRVRVRHSHRQGDHRRC